MNEWPFLESTQAAKGRVKKPFFVEHCQYYSLSAMAIVFGIGIVLAGLIITVVALVIHFSLSPSPVIGYSCVAIWFAFSAWLWVSLVIIGKTDRESRVSDGELMALQALFFINVFGHWLFASPKDKATYHQISLVFEWCVIAFHILYFLLALCVWVRLPLRSYIAFAIMLALAIFQTTR
jgi:hypothetical protein